jgi:hypothetical protein
MSLRPLWMREREYLTTMILDDGDPLYLSFFFLFFSLSPSLVVFIYPSDGLLEIHLT